MTSRIPMPVPSTDPLPWLTERYREAGAFERIPGGGLTDHAVHAMRGTIQSIVSGLQDDEKVFRAVFGKTATAATDMKARLVYIGTAAMQDETLNEGRLASIMTGLAYHEVAHVNHDRDFQTYIVNVLTKEGHEGAAGAHDAHNIGQDLRIEARIAAALPGYAPTLPATLWYVTKGTRVTHMPAGISKSAARNLFFAAVRAPWTIEDWTGWEDALTWGQDWRQRFIDTDKRGTILDLVREALDHIIEWSGRAPIETPKPPEPTGPKTQPTPQQPDDEVRPPDPWADRKDDPDEDASPPPSDDEDPFEDEPADDEEDPDGDGEPTDDEDEPEDDEPDEDADGDPTGGDDEDGESDDAPDEDPGDDGDDLSETWSDDVAETDSGHGAGSETTEDEGEPTDEPEANATSIEDLEFPACSSEALLTAEDTDFDRTATRVEKVKEEDATRRYSHDGWPTRSVRRIWDW